jgi:hypothetical protein
MLDISGRTGGSLKKTLTVWAWSIVTLHDVAVPQLPTLQPSMVEPPDGSACNVTSVPLL